MADHDEASSGSSVEITSEINDGLPTMVNGVDDVCTDGPSQVQQPDPNYDDTQPRLIVSEQPQSRGFRFRYRCEGPSHGGLQGVTSQKSRKTYPAVRILNYQGPARIVVTLVTDEAVPKIHAHELVGKNCQKGICVADLRGNEHKAEFRFQNLGIMHVTKRNVKSILEQRILESMRLDSVIRLGNVNIGDQFTFTLDQKRKAQLQAEGDAKSMQLSVVRLCFQAYLTDTNGQFTRLLPAVLSERIYDSKSPHAAALKICRMDKYGGCCTGNEEVFLLCEKVQKDDISVRFTELDDDGKIIWSDVGSFGPNDVHRQFAIVFKTPPYRDRNIQRAVNVQIQLKRNSDDELSDPKSFTYYPEDPDKEGIDRKRRKLLPGMGPSYNPGDSQPDRGGGSYGPRRGDRSNGPYYSPPSPDRDGYNYGDQAGQQYQYGGDGNHETSLSEGMIKKEQSQSRLKREVGSVSTLPEYDLETDACPCEDDVLPDPGRLDKLRQVVNVADSVDAGFYSQEISTKFSIEESGSFDKSPQKDQKTEQQKSSTVLSGGMMAGEGMNRDMAVYKLAERTSVALQEYAISGDISVLLMVQRHLTLLADDNGDLPLHLAIINRQRAVVKQLLAVMSTIPNANRKINAYNHLHQTPLHLSVLTKQSSVIDLLLKYGADPALVDRHGNTPAHLAAKAGDEACIRALTKYLRPGVTQEKPFPELDIFNYEGLTPMHLAARSGSLDTLKTVCARKADINVADGKSGRTPLHYTVEAGDVSLTGYLLLEANADPNCITFDNNTPLHIACGRELEGMVALLMAAGADPDVENDDRASDTESDIETEATESDSDSEHFRCGMRPCDLACGNKKILRILNGEPYASHQDLQAPPAFTPVTSSTKFSTQDFFPDKPGYESGIGSVFGEMCFLDYTSRMKLSRMLDPPNEASNWRTLAHSIGLGNFVHVWADSASPTSDLLDHLEHRLDDPLNQLRQGLEHINRKDAVTLLDEALSARQREIINRSHGVAMHWTDSGFSDSGSHL